ncbi:adenine phosphoribosyltransferase [Ornithinimicrobium sp. Arc0846-15]|nr:adenine phosphoribosyltransferase [Ornithinimicrobium laminariae]
MNNREELARDVSNALRDVPDFPEKGVVFKDFTPLLADPELSARVVADVVDRRRGEVDVIVGIEARGFIFGSVMAHQLGVPFIPIRKAGKLPAECFQVSYELEYGSAVVEMHTDAIAPGTRALLIDDVLATGGTACAAAELIAAAQGIVAGLEVILELSFLNGRDRLPAMDVVTLLTD